jgi:hypothetical protein
MATQTLNLQNASNADLLARIAELEQKVEKKSKLSNALKFPFGKSVVSIIVSEKGGISFYGFGRFPLTMYKNVLLFVLDHAVELRKFIADHDAELSNGKDSKDVQ